MTRPPVERGPVAVHVVSLGCAKNTVDSERLLGLLVTGGLLLAEDLADADVCLVNTCGFIDTARAETREVLEQLAGERRHGRLRAVAAMGCMVERARQVPEENVVLAAADEQIAFADYPRLAAICRRLGGVEASPEGSTSSFDEAPRLLSGPSHHAYLKISEGCSNTCRFCTIPAMRGGQVSLPLERVVAEAESLLEAGAVEISLIAQDTTSYGRDLYGRRRLADLLRELARLDTDAWFRLMYAYPPHLDDDVLEVMAADSRFCPYIDMPLQHIADPLLQAMGRGMGCEDTIALLDRIPRLLPEVALRTAFIVGFPGETEDLFEELLAFVGQGRFLHMGAFAYSPERRTPAASLPDAVPDEIKQERLQRLMLAQLDVSRRRLRAFRGQTVEVLVDGELEDDGKLPAGVNHVGRTRHQAWEVDGVTLLRVNDRRGLATGDRVSARVVDSLDYDLVAEPAG